MASRIVTPALRLPSSSLAFRTSRFSTSSRRLAEAVPLPIQKPMGAFRGGLWGFSLGTILAGGSVYYYVAKEYNVSNELLTEDIYSLQASVQRVYTHVQTLEEKLSELERKKK